MLRKTTLMLTLMTLLFVRVAIELAHASGTDEVIPPAVPSALRPSAGQVAFLIGVGKKVLVPYTADYVFYR